MLWLIYEEFKLKGAPHVSMYTVWGELFVLTVFCLQFVTSIVKYRKHIMYDKEQEEQKIEKTEFMNVNSTLYKWLYLIYQWALLS
jgi:hypothetical protein